MAYFRLTYSNGYCGCDEVDYVKAENEDEAYAILADGLECYSFWDPDSRFVPEMDDGTEEEIDEAIEMYQADIEERSYVEEISEEEYNDHV